jgi:hypothetical protein
VRSPGAQKKELRKVLILLQLLFFGGIV